MRKMERVGGGRSVIYIEECFVLISKERKISPASKFEAQSL